MSVVLISQCIMGLQLSLLLLLSIFGIHRAVLITHYLIGRNKEQKPAKNFEELPFVTIQLPVYNEPEVIERLIKACTKIDYPRDKFEIQVLDDSTDSTRQKIQKIITGLENSNIQIFHIRRDNRKGFKAGALANGLKTARGEFVAIFDADFIPTENFLMKSIHHFIDSKIGMVQFRWSHLNRDYSLLTRAQAVLLDGHFQIEHSARHLNNCFFNFNGTAGIWRKKTIALAGGWQGDTLTEDLDLSYRAQIGGAKFTYLLKEEVPAELPIELSAFKSQQHRWTKGSVEVFKKLWPSISKADSIQMKVKREAFFHLAANFCYPVLLAVGLLSFPALEAERYLSSKGSFVIPLGHLCSTFVVLGFASIIVFYAIASINSRKGNALKLVIDIPLALITGVALSVSNSIAVFEALLGKKSSFQRTPKTGSRGITEVNKTSYSWRKSLTFVELALCVYFLSTFCRAIFLERWSTLPFIALFLTAFSFFSIYGIRSLLGNRSQNKVLLVKNNLQNH